jgi:hypothetical protein
MLALALAGTLLFAALFGVTTMPFVRDNQQHFYMAERIASGGTSHTSNFEPKHAISHLGTGAAIAAGRLVGLPDHISARLMSVLVLTAAAWLAWRLALQLTGRWLTAMLCFVSIYALTGFLHLGFLGARPKVFMFALILACALFLAQRRHFLAGFFGALVFHCWQPSLMILALGFCVLVLRPDDRNWRPAAAYCLAAFLCLVLYESFFFFRGALAEQIHQTYWFPSNYMTAGMGWGLESLLLLANKWRLGFGALNFIPVITIVGFAALGYTLMRRGIRSWKELRTDQGWLFITLCLFATAAFTWYDHESFADLLLPLPFVTFFSSVFLTSVLDTVSENRQRAVALLFTYFALVSLYHVGRLNQRTFTVQDQIRSAATLRRLLDQGETIFATGCTHLLGLAHSENWVKYGVSFPELDSYLADVNQAKYWVPEKDGVKPSIVLLSRRCPRHLDNWLEEHYLQRDAPDFEQQRVAVYALRDRSAPVPILD